MYLKRTGGGRWEADTRARKGRETGARTVRPMCVGTQTQLIGQGLCPDRHQANKKKGFYVSVLDLVLCPREQHMDETSGVEHLQQTL